MTNEKSIRLDFVDLLKSIAIYFVLMYHFPIQEFQFLTGSTFEDYLGYFTEVLLGTSVTLFLFVNGGLLLTKDTLNIKKHVVKTIKIIGLTIVWGIITIIILSINRGETMTLKTIFSYLYNLQKDWVDHLWFMQTLTIIYIFFPLFYLAFKKDKRYYYFFLVFVFLITCFNNLLGMGAILLSMSTNTIPLNDYTWFNFFSSFNPLASVSGSVTILYFLLGGLYFSNLERFKFRSASLWAIGILFLSTSILLVFGVRFSIALGEVWDVAWGGGESIFTVFNVLAITTLALNYKAKSWYGKLIRLISDYTLIIYLTHMIIAEFLLPYFPIDGLLGEMSFSLIILFLSVVAGMVLVRIPILNRIVTIRS